MELFTRSQMLAEVDRRVERALLARDAPSPQSLLVGSDALEIATLKERLRAATVARSAARKALEQGSLNLIPDKVFDAIHEASAEPYLADQVMGSEAVANSIVEAIFDDLRDRRFLKWLFDKQGDKVLIGVFRDGETLTGLDLEVQDDIKAAWRGIINAALASAEVER